MSASKIIQQRVRARRRLAFSAGLGVMLASATAAVTIGAFGSGCIFDQGGYDGGGRRETSPTATDTESTGAPSTPTTPTTPTSTSTGTPDSGSQVPDTGAPDA